MKKVLLPILFMCAAQAKDSRVMSAFLDEKEVYEIPTKGGVSTMLVFPDNIELIDAKGFVTDPNKQLGKFELGFTAGTNYFSVMPLSENVAMNANISVNGKIYSLEFKTSPTPIYKVLFTNDKINSGIVTTQPTNQALSENDADFEVDERKKLSVARMIGLIDKAKAYPILSQQKDNPVKDILVSFPEKVYQFNGVKMTLRGVFRDNSFDGICFWVDVASLDKKQHYYDVQNFQVKVGNQILKSVTASANGVVPAEGHNSAYFVIAGNGQEGGRNDWAVTNNFEVILSLFKVSAKVPEPPIPTLVKPSVMPSIPPDPAKIESSK